MIGTYNLNLSARYVPEWGAWQVAREVACNAIDADSARMSIKKKGTDTLSISTSTTPDVAQMLVIGEGTKRPGNDTIGQFGEGLKMAALAATRLNPKDGLVLQTPDHTIRFSFQSVMGSETLHAHVLPNEEKSNGFTATINLPNAVNALGDNVQPNLPLGPVKKPCPGPCRVMVKGVYVATLKGASLYDWNLGQLTMNRDRDLVSDWDTIWAIGTWICENATPDLVSEIIQNEAYVEALSLEYQGSARLASAIKESFAALHGSDAVVATGTESDAVATRKGRNVVQFSRPEIKAALKRAGIQDSSTIARLRFDLEPADIEPYRDAIAQIRKLDKLVAAPNVSVRVFVVRDDALTGVADMDDCTVWLSESLFTPGNLKELVTTYLHELAHFMSNANDGSVAFENALDAIAGRLGVLILGLECGQ